MKTTRFGWLVAGLLTLSGAALAQSSSFDAGSPLPAGGRPVLGGPPQLSTAVAGPATPGPDLAPPANQPDQPPLSLAELARLFPQCVHPLASFRPDVAALATAAAVPGSHGLVALTLPLGAEGVPAGGATPGQRLKLLTTSGEQLVAVARPAAAGSRVLVVSAAGRLAGQPVYVVGFEHPAEQALDYAALALLELGTTQQLTQQLATVRQELAGLRHQLATIQKLNGELLVEHAEQQALRQQLNALQSQVAAEALSARRPRRPFGWPAD